MWKGTLQTLSQFNMLLIFFPSRGQKMHKNKKNVSTPKGKEKIIQLKEHGYWAISGHSTKREPEVWDLENQTRQKQALKGQEQEGPQEAGSKGQVWWQETRSFRPSRQESQRLEHKNYQRCFLMLLSKDTRESRGKMVNIKKPAPKSHVDLSSTSF